MEEDYYQILGVSRDTPAADIQKAYRSLARKYHPDVNPDDKAAKANFQKIQQAYEVLNDSEKREMYDRYGASFEAMGGGAGAQPREWQTYSSGPGNYEEFDFFGGGAGGPAGGFESFGDIFKQFGGGQAAARRTRRQPRRGADLRHELDIPFNTAITGGEARLNVQRPSGKVETISVKIPAGIEDGKTIRLRGQGETSPGGGQDGDLLIRVRVASHPCYARRGDNLEVGVPVTLAEAALGAKVDVPTPKGVITLTVPPGTSSGKRLRIKGHGVQSKSGEPGDLYAEIQIALPDKIDDESAELIRRLDQLQPLTPRENLRW